MLPEINNPLYLRENINEMTLRDYFAAKALSTMNIGGLPRLYEELAENAYMMADAMLKASSI